MDSKNFLPQFKEPSAMAKIVLLCWSHQMQRTGSPFSNGSPTRDDEARSADG